MVNKTVVAGSIILVFGLVISVGWFFGFLPVFQPIRDKKLLQATVVDSPQAEGYSDWQQGNALNNPNHYIYYLWNMTNAGDVLAKGTAPEFQQVGPFKYQYIWSNNNANFTDGGNKVEYNLLENYIFQSDGSVSDPTKTFVTNINPAYVAALQQSGGEGNLIMAGLRPLLSSTIAFLTGEYLDVVSSQYSAQLLGTTTDTLVSQINKTGAEDYFYTTWANAIEPPSDTPNANWTGMLLSAKSGTPSGLSLAAVQQLFGNGSYSLVNQTIDSHLVWFNASLNVPEAIALLKSTFGITDAQVTMIAEWRNATFVPIYVRTYLLNTVQQTYSAATWEDVGWYQFVSAQLTSPNFQSVYYDYFPTNCVTDDNDPTELIGFEVTAAGLTIPQAKYFLQGPNGILDVEHFSDFMALANAYVADTSMPADFSSWNITKTQVYRFIVFWGLGFGAQCSLPVIKQYIKDGSGLITTQTADYWLWRCVDPLALWLTGTVEQAACMLQFNYTLQLPSEIYTGKVDTKQINLYTKWRNVTDVSDLWNGTVPIIGFAENGIFPIHLEDKRDLHVWEENFYKTVTLKYQGSTSHFDIAVYKYKMQLDVYNVSELYANYEQGFSNATTANKDAFVFFSNWDYYGVGGKYSNIPNMHPSYDDVTTLLIEPITGNTLKADMKLQVNFWVPPWYIDNWWAFSLYDNVTIDFMYPVMKAWQQSDVGIANQNKLHSQLKFFSKSYLNELRFSISGAGVFVLLLGILLIIVGKRKEKRDDYVQIQGTPKRAYLLD